VKGFYVTEFEKRNAGVKAVFDGSDGKALKTILERIRRDRYIVRQDMRLSDPVTIVLL